MSNQKVEEIKEVSLNANQVNKVLNDLLQRETKPLLIVEVYNIITLLRSAKPIEVENKE